MQLGFCNWQLLFAGTLASNLRKQQLLFCLIHEVSLTLQNLLVECLSSSGSQSSVYTSAGSNPGTKMLHIAEAASVGKCQTAFIKLLFVNRVFLCLPCFKASGVISLLHGLVHLLRVMCTYTDPQCWLHVCHGYTHSSLLLLPTQIPQWAFTYSLSNCES